MNAQGTQGREADYGSQGNGQTTLRDSGLTTTEADSMAGRRGRNSFSPAFASDPVEVLILFGRRALFYDISHDLSAHCDMQKASEVSLRGFYAASTRIKSHPKMRRCARSTWNACMDYILPLREAPMNTRNCG